MAYSSEEITHETDEHLSQRQAEIEDAFGAISPEFKDLALELSAIHCEQLVRAEDGAVRSHGRQILAAIEGTTWVSEAGSSGRDENDSSLVQILDRGGFVAS